MPRPTLTHADRSASVAAAADALPTLLARALATDPADADAMRRAWSAVEAHGATIHRQSRILAGKPRGG